MLRGRILTAVLLALTIGLVGAATAAATTDITGAWQISEDVFHNGVYQYGPGGNEYDITVEDQQGNFDGGPYGFSEDLITGQLTGSSVLFSCTNGCVNISQADREVYSGTLSGNGQTMTGISATCGTLVSPQNVLWEGTWSASLPGTTAPTPPASVDKAAADALCNVPAPAGVDLRHTTSTTVQCVAPPGATGGDVVCVVTVTDTGTPPETPIGVVNFSAGAAVGTFPGGASCELAPATTSAGGPATCSVTLHPGAGGTPAGATIAVQATYAGNADLKPSTAPSAALSGGAAPVTTTTTSTSTSVAGSTTTTSSGGGSTPGSTHPGVTPATGNSTAAAALSECEAFALNGGGEGDSAVAEQVFCTQIASVSQVLGATWLLQSTGGDLGLIVLAGDFSHEFAVFSNTGNAWLSGVAHVPSWNQSQYQAVQAAMHDPPVASYETLATPAIAAVEQVPVTGSKANRAAAKAINRWLSALASSRAAADAFTLTVNRAGGARAASSKVWVGRQMRLAIRFAKQLAADYDALGPLTAQLAALAAHASAAQGPKLAAVTKLRTQIAHSGLTGAERKRLQALGFTAAGIAALVAAAKDAQVPTSAFIPSPAKLLADPRLQQEYTYLALFFRLWATKPSVVADAALGA